MDSLERLKKIWEDQADFNKNFFPPPDSEEEKFRQTKEFVLCMMSELDELLNAVRWKVHRRKNWRSNPAQVADELTDLMKYLVSLMLVWEIDPTQAMDNYWKKSMVCRQRFSEEFLMSLDEPLVVCDIDGVLADYYRGFLNWVETDYPSLRGRVRQLLEERQWLDCNSLGIDPSRWQEMKHRFRVIGGKRHLPIFSGAKEFLSRVRQSSLKIVLLTSRPIDEYPNIYTDTLEWLRNHRVPFDFVWWSKDKGEKILENGVHPLIQFAVDDDVRYANQLAKLGIRTYLINATERAMLHEGVVPISSLEEITLEGKNAAV